MTGDSTDGSEKQPIDISVRPHWMRTGYQYFPYAAWESDQWWVLRANYCFPEHDLVTLFIDGLAIADLTAPEKDARPLVASIAALDPMFAFRTRDIPAMPAEEAKAAVDTVAAYVSHGSEFEPPDLCDLCEFAERDPYQHDERGG